MRYSQHATTPIKLLPYHLKALRARKGDHFLFLSATVHWAASIQKQRIVNVLLEFISDFQYVAAKSMNVRRFSRLFGTKSADITNARLLAISWMWATDENGWEKISTVLLLQLWNWFFFSKKKDLEIFWIKVFHSKKGIFKEIW